jgi:hypothetical protein
MEATMSGVLMMLVLLLEVGKVLVLLLEIRKVLVGEMGLDAG